MPDNIYQLGFTNASVNQGAYGPAVAWKRPRALIATPINFSLSPSDLASADALKAKLQAAAINADPTQRIYILATIQGADPKGKDPVSNAYAYGDEAIVYGRTYAYDLTFGGSNIVEQTNRQKFNGRASEFLWMIIDEEGQLITTKGTDASGKTVQTGFSLSNFYAQEIPMDTGEGYKFVVSITCADAKEFNRGNLMADRIAFNIVKSVKNLADIFLVAQSALTTRVVSIAPMIGDGNFGGSLAAMYPTVLGGASTALTLWKGRARSTGLALTVTTAVKAVLNGVDVITLTFDTTNFPTTGGMIDIFLDTPANLSAAGVQYYESNILTLTV